MKRNISRLKALISLYEFDLVGNRVLDEHFDDLLEEIEDESLNVEYDKKFSETLYDGVLNNLQKIDRTIAICLEKYPLERLSYVDRNLIRIGTYELMFTETHKAIIINEIVELSKEYSQTENFASAKFNNSLLDNIAKRLGK